MSLDEPPKDQYAVRSDAWAAGQPFHTIGFAGLIGAGVLGLILIIVHMADLAVLVIVACLFIASVTKAIGATRTRRYMREHTPRT